MTKTAFCVAALLLPAISLAAPGPQVPFPGLYNNETGVPAETDYAVLQFPPTLMANPLTASGFVFSRIYEAGTTEPVGAPATVLAELGYGAAGSDPRTSVWTWFSTGYNAQVGNDDEYLGTLLVPALPGTYSYTYRFSLDGGTTFTLADLDSAGANPGLEFNPQNLGRLTVVPEPTTLAALASGVAILLRRRR